MDIRLANKTTSGLHHAGLSVKSSSLGWSFSAGLHGASKVGTSLLHGGAISSRPLIRKLVVSKYNKRNGFLLMHAGHDHHDHATIHAPISPPPAVWRGEDIDPEIMIKAVKFNDAGLVPAIAQQWDTGEILMMAWMNAESIRETMIKGRAVYYSRSRKKLWRKGESSGQVQTIRDIVLDCDGDTVLLSVDQIGVACHTGRRSCFYNAYRPPNGDVEIVQDVLIDPNELYKK